MIYVILGAWIASMAIGLTFGAMRGNTPLGFLFPFMFGPLGLLVSLWALKERPVRSP